MQTYSMNNCRNLDPDKNINKWRDIKKVNNSILIDIRFGLKSLRGQNTNERRYVQKVDQLVLVNITQHLQCHSERRKTAEKILERRDHAIGI